MPDIPSLEIRLLAQQGNAYPVEMTLAETQQVFRGQLAGDIAAWSASGDSRADGQALFDRLFASADLMRGWGVAHGKSKQLRVQLRLDAPELHALPWELLRDDQDLLAADADSPFSRYLAVSREWGQAITDRPIRVLAVISNPKDIEEKYGLPSADAELEARALREAIGAGAELKLLPEPVTLDRLEAELRHGYHILHFVGHGAFSIKTQQAALYLQDHDGNAQRVLDDDFAGMLNRLASPPHLVVLAACQSAQQSMKAAFSGLGPKLVQIGVPAVIAMQENVTVLTARQFAATFYQRLLAHGTVDLAMNEARGSLITNGRFDAAVPVLFMRLPDGRLWDAAKLKKSKSGRSTTMSDEDDDRSGGVRFGSGNVTIGGNVAGRDLHVNTGGGDVVHGNQTTVNTGGGAYVGGDVNVSGSGKFVGRDDQSQTGLSAEDVAKLFASIYQQIDAKPNLKPADKEDLKADVKDVEAATAKVAQGEKADESFLERRLRSIARMAPDILDVIASTIANPALGAATVIRKIVDKVKQEAA
jgi:CHAT domain-containing protein